MVQNSFIRKDVRDKGTKRTIKLPAISAGGLKQYTRDHPKLKGALTEYGAFNQVTILNNGSVDIEVSLDYSDSKTYPVVGSSSISLDETVFQEFNVKNLDSANPTIADKITIIVAYENPLLREHMKTKKELFGGEY
jgi:hypothetical protein